MNQPLNNNSEITLPKQEQELDSFRQIKIKRLLQIVRITQLTLLVIGLINLVIGQTHDTLIMLSTGIFLFSVDWAIQKKQALLGATVFLVVITLVLSYLALVGSGIRDVSVLGYCGVMIFAAILGNKRLLGFLVAIMVLSLALISYLNHAGLYQNQIQPTNLATGSMVILVLCVTALVVGLLAQDYRTALEKLAGENTRMQSFKNHIEHLASHDALTGLPNRSQAQRTFSQLYKQARAGNQLFGIIFIDLDNLKPINDSLGHQAGDQILQEVALRLLSYTKNVDTLCRYGGDEFIIFLPDLDCPDQASKASLEILQLVSETYVHQDMDIFCTCSIGIALAPQDGNDLDTLIKNADIAMYHSKDSGRNSFRFFNPSINRGMLDHISLISNMRKALREQQFSLHYQPKIDLHSHQICGFEALLRWHHPEQGFISPSAFIPLAESSGLIIQLGEWVIEEACRQAKCWHQAGLLTVPIAINISSIQFKRGNIDSLVMNALTKTGLSPQYLELELTESLLIEDSERLVSTLSYLRGEGVHLSIDDFGTGYSNLGYLKKFEVETLKIDQSFIRKMDDLGNDAAIVRAIIQMASSLGLRTIAEGVEDAATAALLRGLGCTQAQGYHWARPMPADQVAVFINAWADQQH